MITLPLLPIWIVDIMGAVLVILLAASAFLVAIKLTGQDPENALFLFLFWFTLALLAFAFFRSAGHILKHVLIFSGEGEVWQNLRPWSGGLNSITFVAIAAISLFFYHIQRLYRRMAANHSELEATSREILELNREMEALVIERTMSEMALSIADGIRNPLHIIGGFSQRLLKKTSSDDPARNWAACICKEAKRLEHMVEHFEALAQKKESFFTEVDLNTIVHDILKLIQEEFTKKEIGLVVQLTPEAIWGRFNVYLLKLALAHLLRNAIEATPPKGEIRVTTRLAGSRAWLVMQDTGRGMPQEVVDKVFEPFYTTKIGGTGLGMIFVAQIVDEHRGKINIESQVGQGTTVTIELPLRFAESPDLRLSE
jgi:two-component system, NtrC family, sensor kinase